MENIALGRRGPAAEQAEKVGPYRLEHRLGAGGMGAVWRARDERLKRAVALKRILPTANEDPRLRERFRREAEAVARLNHPAIIHIYDIVETEDSDWIVMELVEGWTLHELLRHEGPLDPQRVLRLGRDVAEGLAEAHSQGFIHRDLKAPNVMTTPSGRAKILDFG
ncbi:MAG TPA: serine/threonine-protein kinase, partial [Thermoanaerobaculia bacterium]|nr:serine/threonine-protein kinase [Thermoanaerobaculia bacterium]